jgi:hypothetical protein
MKKTVILPPFCPVAVKWDVALCNVVEIHRRFGGTAFVMETVIFPPLLNTVEAC